MQIGEANERLHHQVWTARAVHSTQNEMSTQMGFHHWFLAITSSEFDTKQKGIVYFLSWSHNPTRKKKVNCCLLIEGKCQTRKLIYTK